MDQWEQQGYEAGRASTCGAKAYTTPSYMFHLSLMKSLQYYQNQQTILIPIMLFLHHLIAKNHATDTFYVG